MQPQDSSRTTSRGHSSSQSRDARLSEVRGQIDALYNTSNSSGGTSRPTMQPIIGNAPTRQPAPSASTKAATFSVPNLASKPASHAPVVRYAVGGVQHSQTAYRPGAHAWHQSQAAAASSAHSAPTSRERDISSITPRSRSQAHYIGTSAQATAVTTAPSPRQPAQPLHQQLTRSNSPHLKITIPSNQQRARISRSSQTASAPLVHHASPPPTKRPPGSNITAPGKTTISSIMSATT